MSEQPEIKKLWRDQKMEDTVTLANIHERAGKFQRRIYWRNVREYVATAVVILVFGWYAWIFPGWMIKTGSALTIAAALFMIWTRYKQGSSRIFPLEDAAKDIVDFYRRELVRQRDFAKAQWRLALAPVIPGIVLIALGRYYQFPVPGRPLAMDHLVIALSSVIVLLMFLLAWLWTRFRAEKLQRQIDELDKLR